MAYPAEQKSAKISESKCKSAKYIYLHVFFGELRLELLADHFLLLLLLLLLLSRKLIFWARALSTL